MSAEFTSNLGVFLGATERGIHSGLIAAAETYKTDVKEALEHGYTSGNYVTGNNTNHVARGEPEDTGDGWTIPVGSTQTDPPYPLFWEVGHINLFVKRGGGSVMGGYVRVPVWEPTLLTNRLKYYGIVAEEIRAVDGAL